MRCELWHAPDTNRLGVSWTQTIGPVVGYVARNADDGWSAEYKGTILSETFTSAKAAAEAILKLDKSSARGFGPG
jgi:hypothetical protein